MRRLFSTFAHGAPGAGLLLMRVAAGGALVIHGIGALASGPALAPGVYQAVVAVIGILVLLGLWTPVVAVLTALAAAWCGFSKPGDVGFYVLLVSLGAALALLGPGAWSVDARLFGWKRVEIRNGKRQETPPF
jgi:putative oxidoreductase